jgi:copper transport protein
MKPSMWLTIALGLFSVLWVADVSFPSIASAQGPHQHHGSPSISTVISAQELAVGVAHGAPLGTVVFLVGLVAFVVLVWLPANQVEDADQGEAVSLLCRWMWVLVGLLIVAGLVELPLYAVRASGEALSLGLLEEALFDTRVGQLWILRLALGILTATAATYAAQQPRRLAYWWGAAVVVSALLLMTLTQQSHAAAEGGFLPFAADWLHLMAASLWMGGLLGFPILLLGPLRVIPIEPRLKLLSRIVPRFSKVAIMAVMSLILTGLVSILLHIPNLWSLIDTPYGRALSIKLGLLTFLLALGAQNLMLRGRGPFSRLVSTELILAIGIFVATGFLTSLPPADAEQPTVEGNIPNPAEDIRQPPMPNVQSATAQPKE